MQPASQSDPQSHTRTSSHSRHNSSSGANPAAPSLGSDQDDGDTQTSHRRSSSSAFQRIPFLGGGSSSNTSAGGYFPLSTDHLHSQSPAVVGVLHSFASHLLIPIITGFLAVVFFLSLVEPSNRISNIPDYGLAEEVASKSQVGPALSRSVQENTSLNSATCQREFPLLFSQLTDNAQAWRARAGIKKSDIDGAARTCEGGCAHLLISNGQIFLRTLVHDWQSRTRAVLEQFEIAVQGATWEEKLQMEGLELVFSAADKLGVKDDRGAGWVLDKKVSDPAGQYLLPDFSFTAWPEAGIASYSEFRRDAAEINKEYPWTKKEDKLFWRGDPTVGAPPRINLMQQIAKPNSDLWSDVKRTSFWETGPGISPIISPKDHCKHKYLLHSEGNSYSGRSKFILGCSSTVILHELEWTQHFHPALIFAEGVDQNVIKSPGNLFDQLEELANGLHTSDQQSIQENTMSIGQRIASNANRTLTNRYLSPAATACYLRAALISYNSVLDRSSWPAESGSGSGSGWTPSSVTNNKGPSIKLGGGIKPGTGAGDHKGDKLKEMHLEEMGDIQLSVWQLLGGPQWPPR
ncbi:unnamed protein product [Sympodiomycopsis kandeliae]